MKKIILNKCYGGFGLSKEAYELYAKKKGLELYSYEHDFYTDKYKYSNNNSIFEVYFTKDFGNNVEISDEDYDKYNLYLRVDCREDKELIEVVEELGEKANGECAELEIIEIPDNAFYVIDEYDGFETIYYSESEILSK